MKEWLILCWALSHTDIILYFNMTGAILDVEISARHAHRLHILVHYPMGSHMNVVKKQIRFPFQSFVFRKQDNIFTSRVSGRSYRNGPVYVCVCVCVRVLALSRLNS